MKALLLTLLVFIHTLSLEALMVHLKGNDSIWKEEKLSPFNELILSWNASRPENGKYLFYVSLKTDDWSPWLLYASWGSNGQKSFSASCDAQIRVYQDAVEVLKDKQATGFQIGVISEGSASLKNIHSLHVYTNSKPQSLPQQTDELLPIHLDVMGVSQMTLNHSRCKDLCSPASTTAVVQFLSNKEIDPVCFAENVLDDGFDIYGNWVFNVAQASAELGPSWNCWVERLANFNQIYQYLLQGCPVVVSVRGPLPGSAKAYAQGHLIAVVGYDPLQKKVRCMDPAFSTAQQTCVNYELSAFQQAWSRRGNIAYIFTKNCRP